MGGDERPKKQRVTSRDIPNLLDMLACDDPLAQADTLTLLCPCRNVRYDKEVWEAIFRASVCSDDPVVRDRAHHAIGTLRERARIDPRSQKLVRWLVDQHVAPPAFVDAIPAWRPFGLVTVNGLSIPQYQPPVRSRHKRQRR